MSPVFIRRFLFALAILWSGVRAAGADSLATLHYEVVGTQLRVAPSAVAVPKGIAGSVRIDLLGAAAGTNGTATAANSYVEATLRGPAFSARRLVGRVNDVLLLPAIGLVGDYQLDGIRLVDATTGATRMEGTPSSVPVKVFDEVLVSHVTSRPLTLQEIQDRGIVIDQDSFRAVEFEVGFVLDGQTFPIKFPVVAPEYRQNTDIVPAAELQKRLATAAQINQDIASSLASLPLPEGLDRPGLNIQVKGLNFQPAEVDETSLRLPIPPIPALMVIPGNIGFLDQHFSVQVFTENGAPLGSGLSVLNVNASLALPTGPDGSRSTNYSLPGDDPLRFARVGPKGEIISRLPILGPAPARLARFNPGEGGSAEFLVEGLQEGLHTMDLDLTADLDGLAAGTVKVQGKAAGSVLVRNPRFSLGFSHPRTVRAGEPYEARVTLLNTGLVEANALRITLRNGSISGGALESPEVVELGNLAPGASATAVWRVRPQRTGQVSFSNLTTGSDSVTGRFNLRMGIDERGVELSPDALALPDLVTNLPPALVDAASRVLGQALSVATAAQLPTGVRPVSRNAVVHRALELAEAGQRLRYGDTADRIYADLLLDWQGGRFASEGFDQIVSTTEAGSEFRSALVAVLESLGAADAPARLRARAADIAGRGEAWLLSAATGASGATAPTYLGSQGGWAVTRSRSQPLSWTFGSAVPSAVIRVLETSTNGTGRLVNWNLGSMPAGACAVYQPGFDGLSIDTDCDGTFETQVGGESSPANELPPVLLTVTQDTALQLARPYPRCSTGPANNYGNVIAVLFSKAFTQADVDHPEAFQLDGGNRANGVRLQQGGRVALLSLNEPISALIPRSLSVSGIRDARGNEVPATSKAIETAFKDGVSMRGRVLRADGNPAVGVPVTVTFHDPYRDPFDRCDPIVETSIAQKFTDENGLFSFDFVHGGVGVTIAAVDTLGLPFEFVKTALSTFKGDQFSREKLLIQIAQSNLLAQVGVSSATAAVALAEGLDRAVWSDYISFEGGRIGHEAVIGLRFRGRGSVLGQVVNEVGTAVAHAAVNLFPDTDSREKARGLFSDAQGRFEFRGVPLGTFSIQVKTGLGQFRTVSGLLKEVGGTNQLVIALASPSESPVIRGTLGGRVTEPDHLQGVARARVFVRHFQFGVIGEVTTDNDGNWQMADVPVGSCQVQGFSADLRRAGQANVTVIASAVAHVEVPLSGTAIVKGRVRTSAGVPVEGALVAGGEELVRTAADGSFTLAGVPIGQRRLQAAWEGTRAPGGLTRLGEAALDVLPGDDNFAVIELRPVGKVVGRVFDAQGHLLTDPDLKVAIPISGGFLWAKVNPDTGVFVFPNLPPGSPYTVVAPSPPVDDVEQVLEELSTADLDAQEQLSRLAAAVGGAVSSSIRRVDPSAATPLAANSGKFGYSEALIRLDGETVSVDIHYLPTGSIKGTVLNHQGVPIGARVRATAFGVKGDATVGMITYGDRNSDAGTGEFEFNGIPVGPWGIQAASPFYTTVLSKSGRTTLLEPSIADLELRFPSVEDTAGRLSGVVLMPDGSRAPEGVNVKISFSADYAVRTDADGFFDTQIKLPARSYQVEAIDPASGLRAQLQATVRAGVSNFITVPLLGKGSLVARVLMANGQPAVGAAIRADHQGYPAEQINGVTGPNGELRLDNLFAGGWSVYTSLPTGAAKLEGRAGGTVEVGTVTTVPIRLGGTASLRGTFVRRADGTPVPFARVSVGNAANVTTDDTGRFEVTGLSLGNYRVVARDPLDGRLGAATVTLGTDGQVLEVNVVELARGIVRGQVFQAGRTTPVAGAQVNLHPDDSLFPPQQVTTGPDGAYEFVAVGAGSFQLFARLEGLVAPANVLRATMPSEGGTLELNPSLPAEDTKGVLTLRVLAPDGKPAPFARVRQPRVADTDAQGVARFEGLRLQAYTVLATDVGENSSSAVQTNVVLSATNPAPEITVQLSGVNRLDGRVIQSVGDSPAAGAEVSYESTAGPLRFLQRATLADADGRFHFDNLPVGSYRLIARLGALAANESGQFTSGGRTNTASMRLGNSGTVIGRLVRANGTNALPGQDLALTFNAPSGFDGIAQARTDAEGRFRFESMPTGITLRLVGAVQLFNGLLNKTLVLSGNGVTRDLGDVLLDEDWPFVFASSPAAGATDAPTTSPIELTFSEELNLDKFFANGFQLRSPTTNVPVGVVLTTDSQNLRRVVRLVPQKPLRSLTSYQVVVLAGTTLGADGQVLGTGPIDAVGRPLLQPYVASFTTRDDDPPTLLSLSPEDGAEEVPPGAVVRMTFNEPIRSDGFSLAVVGPAGLVTGRTDVVLGGRGLVFTPLPGLPINTQFTIRLDGVRDLAGNALTNQPRAYRFETLDTLGPKITSLRLANAALPVAGSLVEVEAELAAAEPGASVRFTLDLQPLGGAVTGTFRKAIVLPASGSVRVGAIARDRHGNDGEVVERVFDVVAPSGEVTLSAPAALSLTRGQFTNIVIRAVSPDANILELAPAATNALPFWADINLVTYDPGEPGGSADVDLTIDSSFAEAGEYLLTFIARTAAGAFASTNIALSVAANPDMQVTRWKDPVSGSWRDTNRWTAGLPSPTRPAIIDLPGDYTITTTSFASVLETGSIRLGGGGSTPRLVLDRTLTNNAVFRVLPGATFHMDGFNVYSGMFAVGGLMEFDNGYLRGPGRRIVQPGGIIRSIGESGGAYIHTGVLEQYGTLELNGHNGIDLWDATLRNFGTMIVRREYVAIGFISGSVPCRLWNQGLIVVDTATSAQTAGSMTFDNEGIVRIARGRMEVADGGTNSGRFEVESAGVLRFNHAYTHAPGSVLAGDGLIDFAAGVHDVRGQLGPIGGLQFGATSLTIRNPVEIRTGHLAMTNGPSVIFEAPQVFDSLVVEGSSRLGGSGDVRVTREFRWGAGTLDGSGSLILEAGATGRTFPGNFHSLNRRFVNLGTFTWADATDITFSGSVFENRGAFVSDVAALRHEFRATSLGGRFQNLGTLRQSGTNVLRFSSGVTLDNTGILRIDAGAIQLWSTSTNRGAVQIAAAGSYLYDAPAGSGAQLHLAEGTTFSGTGLARFSGPLLRILTDVNFGELHVQFELPTQTIFGTGSIANSAGGVIDLMRNGLTLPGSLDIGGTLRVLQPAVVPRTLTLRAGATLDNVANNLRAGAWIDEGGLVIGLPPVVVGLPPGGMVAFTGLVLDPDGAAVRPESAPALARAVLEWTAPSGSRSVVEASADLVHWERVPTPQVTEDRPGIFRATLPATLATNRFFRLRLE